MGEFEEVQEKRRRVLRAAYELANGTPWEYVNQDGVMQQSGVRDKAEYMGIVGCLEATGQVADATDEYEMFVLTPEGIEATGKR